MHRMSNEAITVLVVEDDQFTRTTLCAALRHHGLTVAGEAKNARGGLEFAKHANPDAALLDLDLGGGPSGIDLAHALRKLHPQIGIVILTTYEDPRMAGHSLATLPANTKYLLKRDLSDSAALPLALSEAVEAATGQVLSAIVPPLPPRTTAGLTATQLEVMRLVAEGYSNGGIAEQRTVTEGAVEKMIHRIGRHLGVDSESQSNQRVLIAREYLRLTGAPVRRNG